MSTTAQNGVSSTSVLVVSGATVVDQMIASTMLDTQDPAAATAALANGRLALPAAAESPARKRPHEGLQGGGIPQPTSLERMFEMMVQQQKSMAGATAAASAATQVANNMMMWLQQQHIARSSGGLAQFAGTAVLLASAAAATAPFGALSGSVDATTGPGPHQDIVGEMKNLPPVLTKVPAGALPIVCG